MTLDEAKAVARRYREERGSEGGHRMGHAMDMCARLQEFGPDQERKAMRWLGFIQGVLWCEGAYTIEEMKGHNRPK